MAFCSAGHVFVKALDKAEITFPTTKKEIIAKLGDIEVQVADDKFVSAASIVEAIQVEDFPNGTAFMCAYTSAMYKEAEANMESVKKFNA